MISTDVPLTLNCCITYKHTRASSRYPTKRLLGLIFETRLQKCLCAHRKPLLLRFSSPCKSLAVNATKCIDLTACTTLSSASTPSPPCSQLRSYRIKSNRFASHRIPTPAALRVISKAQTGHSYLRSERQSHQPMHPLAQPYPP